MAEARELALQTSGHDHGLELPALGAVRRDDPNGVGPAVVRRDPRIRPELGRVERDQVVLHAGLRPALHEPRQGRGERRDGVELATVLVLGGDEVAEVRQLRPQPEEQ